MEKILNCPRLRGRLRAPASKSEAHRALITAALAYLYGGSKSPRRVRCTDLNKDIEATVACLGALGATLERLGEGYLVTPITAIPPRAEMDCGESGSTLRFLLPVCCALGSHPTAPAGFTAVITCHGRLPERPLSPLYEELVAHGAYLSPKGSNPFVVQGKLTAGDYRVDGGVSSQFISGLLLALPLLEGDSTLTVTGKRESVPYVEMTLDAISRVTNSVRGSMPSFKVLGQATAPAVPSDEDFPVVGGDWSAAAFFLTAGVLGEGDRTLTVTGLDRHTRQGDRAVLDVLQAMDGRIGEDKQGYPIAYPSRLRGCEIDASQIPDLVPVLAVAASVAEGETRITCASRLRLKESDRLKTVTDMLTALGGNVTETDDGLIIQGVPRLTGGVVQAAGDHRIAMSAAVAATVCRREVVIVGAEAVEKSYPSFWEEFERITEV